MNAFPVKKHPTISCCGVDCGLCPRYHTNGASKCPGCSGPDFHDRHPSCSFVTCCVKNKKLEVCSLCSEFPCPKYESWREGGLEYDSFVTHRAARANFEFVRAHGLEEFLEQQATRIKWLETALSDYDEGRSKSYYCLAASLLTLKDLRDSLDRARRKIEADKVDVSDKKMRSKILRGVLMETAAKRGVELVLKRKPAES